MDSHKPKDRYLIDTASGTDFSGRDGLLDVFFPRDRLPVARPVEIQKVARDEIFPGPVNSYGFRGDEFSDSGDFNIAYFGCSWVEGWGVARGEIFTDQTSKILESQTGKKIRSYNFGLSATGIDHTARLLPLARRHLTIDLVVIVISGLERRELFAPSGKRRFFARRALERAKKKDFPITPEDLAAFGNLHDLSNPESDCGHLLSYFNLISTLLDGQGLPWVFTHIDWKPVSQQVQPLLAGGYLPTSRYLGKPFKMIDRCAFDAAHPGPKSHLRFAQRLSKSIVENNLIDSAAERREGRLPLSSTTPLNESLFSRLKKRVAKRRGRRETGREKDKDNTYPQW